MSNFVISIVYDTCFLISGSFPVVSSLLSFEWTLQHIIGTEVKQELAGLLANAEKKPQAAQGRGNLVGLMSQPGYIEVNFRDYPRIVLAEPVVGPDSEVDCQLLSYVADISHRINFIFVATKDGGIEAEIAAQHRRGNFQNIFSPLTKKQFLVAIGTHHINYIDSLPKCPKCGFRFAFNGTSCGHCHHRMIT